jgi:hypothetical protein
MENGRVIPLWRWRQLEPFEGDIVMEPYKHEVFNRHMQVAMLTIPMEAGGDGKPALPYLYDACVHSMNKDKMTISGFYWDDTGKIAEPQSWVVEILARDYREWVRIYLSDKAEEEAKKAPRLGY